MLWRRRPTALPVWKPWPQCLARANFFWNDFYLTKWFPVTERVKLRIEAQFFNVFNHPNFGLPSDGTSRHSWKAFDADGFWSTHLHNGSADWLARCRFGWR